ncbi:Glu-tRNA(Gln) amidotransferase subunit GatD [Nanoarchaeota archaeon]
MKEGDVVRIRTSDEEIEGVVLPSFDEKIVLLKLNSGYNVGIEKRKIKNTEKLGVKKNKSFPEAKAIQKKGKPGVSMIATGGTISSRVDYSTGAVKPLMSPQQLFFLAPRLLDTLKVNKIERPFAVLSENMTPKHWQKIAKLTADLLNKKENRGIIITHGTDVLHYTAAALSFMLKDLNKPVVLTYSQRSTDRGSTDTVLNLTCAGYAAISDIAEVMLVGHSSSSDDECYALRGVKCRKMHTSRRDTFRPINDLPIARINEVGTIMKIGKSKKKDEKRKVVADTAFEEKIALIKYTPGADAGVIDYYVRKGFKGLVIEATGMGHVSTDTWLPAIEKAIKKGVVVCFAPQTLYGKLNQYIYSSGRELADVGVIFLEDILPETAYVKLGWVLGHEKNPDKVRKMMLQNIAGEFNPKITDKTFLY